MINQRLIDIVIFLLKQKSYVTIDAISKALNVSNRTIRNDLNELDPWLLDLKLSLIKKTGTGIKIDGPNEARLKAFDSLKSSKQSNFVSGPESRLRYMALKLTITDHIRIFELAEELFVSRATIHKDLEALTEFLDEHDVQLIQDKILGLSITGKEKDIRKMMFKAMIQDESMPKFTKICKNSNEETNGDFIFYGLDLTDDEILDFIKHSKIHECPHSDQFSLTGLTEILIRCIISFQRVENGHTIALSKEFIEELKVQDYQDSSQFLLNHLESRFKIKFPEEEYSYLQVFFLSLLSSGEHNHTINLFAKQLIKIWSQELKLDLTHDAVLKKQLITHLIPVHARILYSIPIENKMMLEIQQMYPNTLKIVDESIKRSDIWAGMSDEDVAFIALHLAAALERQKHPLNCALVYSGGLGSRILLKNKIENSISEIKITQEINFASIDDHQFNDIDLIISTLDINIKEDIPIIKVNNLISEHDLLTLKDVIAKYYKEKNNPKRAD